MVNKRRFFAMVWRTNALLILVGGVLAVGVLGVAGWQIYKEATRTRSVSNVVNVAEEQIDKSKARLGKFEKVAGSTVLRAPLMMEQDYAFGSSSKETSFTQNYLFYDSSSGEAHWLAPDKRGLFLSAHEIPARDYADRKTPVVAFLYEYVTADTNGDSRLTYSDLKVLAISDAMGARFTRLVERVQELNGSDLSAEGRLVVLYTSSDTLRSAHVDIHQQKVLQDSPLKTVAKK